MLGKFVFLHIFLLRNSGETVMYLDDYKRWLAADLEDADLKPELAKIEGNDEESRIALQ